MTETNLENLDKVPEGLRDSVIDWSKITTVTINDDGLFMLDIKPDPGFSGATTIISKQK